MDTFRTIHPDTHGYTFHRRASDRPSRIDGIWCAPAWAGAIKGGHACASVDTKENVFALTDHYATAFNTTFQSAFGTHSHAVRVAARRAEVTHMDTRVLQGERLALFQAVEVVVANIEPRAIVARRGRFTRPINASSRRWRVHIDAEGSNEL